MSEKLVRKWTMDQWLFGPKGLFDYMNKLRKSGANIHQIEKLTGIVHKFSDFDILHSLSDWSLGFLHGAAGQIINWAEETISETKDAYVITLLRMLIHQAQLLQSMIMKVLKERGIDLDAAINADPFPVGPGPIVAN